MRRSKCFLRELAEEIEQTLVSFLVAACYSLAQCLYHKHGVYSLVACFMCDIVASISSLETIFSCNGTECLNPRFPGCLV